MYNECSEIDGCLCPIWFWDQVSSAHDNILLSYTFVSNTVSQNNISSALHNSILLVQGVTRAFAGTRFMLIVSDTVGVT
jgi:hypothetical protein